MPSKPHIDHGDPIVPFVPDAAHVPVATAIRSTMISSSVAALRARGLFDAYRANLPPERRDDLPATVAGFWLPMEAGITHYEACDRLRLPMAELIELGANVGDRSSRSALSVVGRLVAETGATPWTVLGQARRLWERAFQGSAIAVFKLGPKEARVEIVAWPLARIEYNRVSLRGVLRMLVLPLCGQVYVHEIPGLCSRSTVGYRVAWA